MFSSGENGANSVLEFPTLVYLKRVLSSHTGPVKRDNSSFRSVKLGKFL